ncbi:hypothetical protein H4Q26_011012 [Puccinia striiformis f. sp. tritici PST-130]|nr:hypothetical protein H4Q26_011012 [Puccinia striiformis f. sp. tritici PST-130]
MDLDLRCELQSVILFRDQYWFKLKNDLSKRVKQQISWQEVLTRVEWPTNVIYVGAKLQRIDTDIAGLRGIKIVAAARVLDQTMMVVDEGISQVEPVVDDTPENHLAGWLEPNVTEIVDDPPIIPLDMFNQEESGNENDDDREELLWMQFLDIAMYMIASLLVGYLHKIISRDLYHQIRAVFTVYHIQLPRWEAVRQMRATIRSMSNHSIIQKESVFNQPMFGLDMKELIADVRKDSLRFDESVGGPASQICARGSTRNRHLQIRPVYQVAQTP